MGDNVEFLVPLSDEQYFADVAGRIQVNFKSAVKSLAWQKATDQDLGFFPSYLYVHKEVKRLLQLAPAFDEAVMHEQVKAQAPDYNFINPYALLARVAYAEQAPSHEGI